MLKIEETKMQLRGDITFFLQKSRNLFISPKDRSEKIQRMSKLELWLILREVRDSRISNDEIQSMFQKFGITLFSY